MSKEETKVVIWEKFKFPADTSNEDMETDYEPPEEENIFEDGDIKVIDADDFIDIMKAKNGQKHMIMTPFGAAPLVDYNNLTKVFNMWVGHTNFWLTPEIEGILNTTSGVEALTVLTPYRFRIAIGKAFNSAAVKYDIQKKLGVNYRKKHV